MKSITMKGNFELPYIPFIWLQNQGQRKFSYISNLLNLYGFIKLTPFKIGWNEEENSFRIQISRFQQICCAILHLICLHPTYQWVVPPILSMQAKRDLMSVFFLLENVITIVLHFHIRYTLWCRQTDLLKLINQTFPFILPHTKKNWLFLIGVLFGALLIRNITYDLARHEQNAELYLDLITCNFPPAYIEIRKGSIPYLVAKYVLTIVLVICKKFGMLQNFLIISVVLTLRQAWKISAVEIQQPTIPFSSVFSVYTNMKDLINLTNDLFATPLLLIYVMNVSFFASVVCSFLTLEFSFGNMLGSIVYIVQFLIIWWEAARLHQNIRATMKSYANAFHRPGRKPISLEERLRLASFMDEVDFDGLGLSCKLYTITYASLATMFAHVATYTIIAYPIWTRW